MLLCHKEMDEPLGLHTKKPKTTEFLSQKEKKKKIPVQRLWLSILPLHVTVTAIIKLSRRSLIRGRNHEE